MKALDDIDLNSPSYTPRRLLEEVMWVLYAKNRDALAHALEVDPGIISRIWNLKAPLSDGIVVRIMDRTNWSIAYVRELAGLPYTGDVYPSRPRGVVIQAKRPRNYHLAKDDILQAMPGTVDQLAKKSGYNRGTVERWLKVLRAGDPETRASHIGGWIPPKAGQYTAIHHAGPGEDVAYTLPHRRDRRKGYTQQHDIAQHSTS